MSDWKRGRCFDIRLAGYSKETNTATVEVRQGMLHRARLLRDTIRGVAVSHWWLWLVVAAWGLRFIVVGQPLDNLLGKGGQS